MLLQLPVELLLKISELVNTSILYLTFLTYFSVAQPWKSEEPSSCLQVAQRRRYRACFCDF